MERNPTMTPIRIVVCLLPSAALGLTVGACLRAALPNRPVIRTMVGLALMPAVGYAGGLLSEYMVRETEGML